MTANEHELRSSAMSNSPAKQVKRVTVTSKRQVSIPKSFAEELDIQGEVLMELSGNKIILKPVGDPFEDFSEEILTDLINEGYAGEELKQEFKYRKSQIRPAAEAMMADAVQHAESTTIDELFHGNDDDQ